MTHSKRRTVLAMTTSLKGGTGKSFLASAFLDVLRHRQVPVAAFDADGAIGALSAMHAERDEMDRMLDQQDAGTGVVAYNIRDESRTRLIDSLACPEPLILHDLAGGSLADLQRLFDDRDGLGNFLRTAERLGITLAFLHTITPDRGSVESVAIHMDLSEPYRDSALDIRHVAILNRRAAPRDSDFPVWFGDRDPAGVPFGGRTRARFLEAGGIEMNLPAVEARTAELVKRLQIPWRQAVRDPRLQLTDQQRVQNFLEQFEAQMPEGLRNLAGLPA
jgi:hypothetical protein